MAASRKRLLFWLGASALAAAGVAQLMPARSPVAESPAVSSQSHPPKEIRGNERLATLPDRAALDKPRGELFGPRSWEPPPRAAAEKLGVKAKQEPAAPAMPYRVAGQVVSADGMRVVLSKGDRIFEVRQGESLEDGYRVESISPRAITLTYVPLGLKQELQVAGFGLDLAPSSIAGAAHAAPAGATAPRSAQAASGAAQLRFEGPRQVRAGTPFDVALKLTSSQPVRALPMQLSFDAKRLEPLAVRAGDFFPGGTFAYRVNPGGSILVGASGYGRAGADANFLIVTFRPIGPGPAELKVSSLLLQGTTGGAVAHVPPEIFRAAIVQ